MFVYLFIYSPRGRESISVGSDPVPIAVDSIHECPDGPGRSPSLSKGPNPVVKCGDVNSPYAFTIIHHAPTSPIATKGLRGGEHSESPERTGPTGEPRMNPSRPNWSPPVCVIRESTFQRVRFGLDLVWRPTFQDAHLSRPFTDED
jgi:hypothetical protein